MSDDNSRGGGTKPVKKTDHFLIGNSERNSGAEIWIL